MNDMRFNTYSMLSTEERLKLFYITKNVKLLSSDCILEYGVFFGGSLEPLSKGLFCNIKYNQHEIIGIDSFSASKDGSFYTTVLERANIINIKEKSHISEIHVDWFEFVKEELIQFDNIKLVKGLPSTYVLENTKTIAILHLDMPKFYTELSEILHNIINNLRHDSFIIFQDYFYHWSAEIIAFGYYLIKNEIIILIDTCRTSLYANNISMSSDILTYFDDKINDSNFIINLLIEASKYFENKVNHEQIASLYMAITQYSFLKNDMNTFNKFSLLIDKVSQGNQYLSDRISWMNIELKEYNYDIYSNYIKNFDDINNKTC